MIYKRLINHYVYFLKLNNGKQDVFVKHIIMLPIMTDSKDGHGHKDEYLDTSRKTLSQEMQYENSNIYVYYVFRSYDQCQFLIERSDVMVKRFNINR